MKSFTATKSEKLTEYLLSVYGGSLTYGSILTLLKNKDIKVNGKRINKDIIVNFNDEIIVYSSVEPIKIRVIYKDENLLVVDKPSGIEVETLAQKVIKDYPTSSLLHRLDRNTTGLICFSLNERAYIELTKAFKERTVTKYYLAEVYGKPLKPKGLLTAYLVKNSDAKLVKIYSSKVAGSVQIKTEYEVIKTLDKTSVLKVNLITGKTHQIRAHLAFIGHFIIGDTKYGDNKINKEFKEKRQKLIAKELKFNFSENSPLYYLNKINIALDKDFN